MTLSFTFQAPCKRASSNGRYHWAQLAGLTSKWRQAATAVGMRMEHLFPDPPVPVNILVTFEVPDPTRRRDPMNTYPTVKAIVDGLVNEMKVGERVVYRGMLPDDDAKWVTIIQPEFVKGVDRVRVDITPRGAT